MPETVEDIIARTEGTPASGGESVEDILKRNEATGAQAEQTGAIPQQEMVAAPKYPMLMSPKAYGSRRLSLVQKQEEAARGLQKLKTLTNIGLTVGGAELGGLPVATEAIVPRILARMTGAWVGNVLGRSVESGQLPSTQSAKEAAKTALWMGGTEAALRTPAYWLARMGGVHPEAASLAQDDMDLMTKLEPGEYKTAASSIAEHAKNLPQTPEHFGYNMLLRARGPIDGRRYVQAIRGAVDTGKDVDLVVERNTASLADKLEKRLGPDGSIGAEDLDDWIRKNLREPSAKVYERRSDALWANRQADLDRTLSPQLYKDIGGSAEEFQAETARKLSVKQGLQKWLPEQTPFAPNVSTPGKLRQVLSEGDFGQETRDRLKAYDKEFGTNNYGRVQRLAMRSSWTGAENEEMQQILANVASIRVERPGLMRSAGRLMGRGLTKTIRPVAAGVAAKKAPNEASPEQNFPGMTNAPTKQEGP